ncbi:hypothetical protein GGR56DRAFT_312475 [Xylariaceae sp. FL0804]|nr:hypothetical protein GGR56DRAFT_312475 [Xylariaceae sp. FL0804]
MAEIISPRRADSARRADHRPRLPDFGDPDLLAANIYYREGPRERRDCLSPTLPTPQIRPRSRRPQSIHIVSYPPGYIPTELRPLGSGIVPVLTSPPGYSPSESRLPGTVSELTSPPIPLSPPSSQRRGKSKRPRSTSWPVRRMFAKVLALKSHFIQPEASIDRSASPDVDVGLPPPRPPPQFTTNGRRPYSMIILPSARPTSLIASPTMPDSRRSPMLAAALNNSHRNSVMSARSSVKSVMSSVTEVPKPVASGSGVQCSIILAEPNVFLTGFEHDGHPRHEAANSSALLRGKLQLNVTKNVKLRSVTLKLHGKARTEWPEGIPPMKVDQYEEASLRTQVLTFFNAMHETWETDFGNQCTYTLRSSEGQKATGSMPNASTASLALKSRNASKLTPRDYNRLSLQSVQSRSFGKSDSPNAMQPPKTYKVFYPGTYEYSFELPIDHHQLETIKLQFGSVKWDLETIVERAGAFKPNLHGSKEVRIVRVPDQLSLEMSEPISISRQWEDQLHYDIMISGKSFPIGTKVPIAFKLTPLAKVQVHKVKVYATESIEYWTNDRRVTRKDPGRKILLLEKSAGKPLDKAYENSDVRILSGGELTPDQRQEARIAAQRRRSLEASRAHTAPQPLPDPSDNMLGDLDLGLETYWGPTEIEMNVQIPTCEQMAKDKAVRLHPDCSWKNVNVYHWIKIVMRISRLDPEDPAGKRRRHFEISIDSPFTVLDCRATQANMALPEYSGADLPMYRQHARCGCPDADILATNPSPSSSTGTIPSVEPSPGMSSPAPESPGIAPPPAAHVQQHPAASSQPVQRPHGLPQQPPSSQQHHQQQQQAPRPIHLLRYPSFNPPAFDAEDPPPPMPTPPPGYDVVIGTPSVDGMADYFARLGRYEDGDDAADDSSDDDDDGEVLGLSTPNRIIDISSGRVNVPHPRTPGGRLGGSRSLELQRPVIPMTLSMAGALQERRG